MQAWCGVVPPPPCPVHSEAPGCRCYCHTCTARTTTTVTIGAEPALSTDMVDRLLKALLERKRRNGDLGLA
jgi:hypothetical protein